MKTYEETVERLARIWNINTPGGYWDAGSHIINYTSWLYDVHWQKLQNDILEARKHLKW